MNIHLHIEHLVLEGLPITAAQSRLVQAAVESELVRILNQGELPAAIKAGGAHPNLGSFNIQNIAAEAPRQFGEQIGRAIYRGLVTAK